MLKNYKIIMKKIFIIDNYDSFTYNLVHYFHELNCKTIVKRNDEFNINEVKNYNNIVLFFNFGDDIIQAMIDFHYVLIHISMYLYEFNFIFFCV